MTGPARSAADLQAELGYSPDDYREGPLGEERGPLAPRSPHPQVAEAIEHLEAADVALCRVVAALAVARGWKEDEPYEATGLEQWWHDRIRELGALRDRLQDPPE